MLRNPSLLFPIALLLFAANACTPPSNSPSTAPRQATEQLRSPAAIEPTGGSAPSVAAAATEGKRPVENAEFQHWLNELAEEARGRGISEGTLEDALTGLRPIPRATKAAKTQAEKVFSTSRYLERMVSEERIRGGARQIRERKDLFDRVSAAYGVQPAYLAALWAIESDFGTGKAKFPLIGALATQAWEGQRRKFFRRELLAALTILDREGMKSEDLRGSWAGASGQFQFIPTTYLHYGVDFNQDGRANIWTDVEDALASAANLLASGRWKEDGEWGTAVQLPENFNLELVGLDNRKPLKEWRRLGLGDADGPEDTIASLILPDGPDGPAFLVFDNFRLLLRWNRSYSFALTIGRLADRIRAEKP